MIPLIPLYCVTHPVWLYYISCCLHYIVLNVLLFLIYCIIYPAVRLYFLKEYFALCSILSYLSLLYMGYNS
jgi:hypothetical protein